MCASVVPYAVDNTWGNVYFLMGRESKLKRWRGSGQWADFGGGSKREDADVEHTAAREFFEETRGIVKLDDGAMNTPETLAETFRQDMYTLRMDFQDNKHGKIVTYTMFFVQVPFQSELSALYQTDYKKAVACSGGVWNDTLEKDAIAWFSKEKLLQIMATKRSKLRPHFKIRMQHALSVFPFPCRPTAAGKSKPPVRLPRLHTINAATYKQYHGHERANETSGRLLLFIPSPSVCAEGAARAGAESRAFGATNTDGVGDGIPENNGSISVVPPGFEACA